MSLLNYTSCKENTVRGEWGNIYISVYFLQDNNIKILRGELMYERIASYPHR